MDVKRTSLVALVLALAALGCSKSKAALEECREAPQKTAAGLKTCSEAWRAHADSGEFYELTSELDKRLDAACKDSSRVKDCDTYCPIRIADPGPRNKSITLSMCVLKGYGTLDGQVAKTRPARFSESSPEVIEACVSRCGGRSGANPSSATYKSCFAECKVKKAAELNR